MPNLIIGEVELIHLKFGVVALDGEVASLEDHWQRLGDVCLVVKEFVDRMLTAGVRHDVFLAMSQQAHKIGWRAGGEPVVPHVEIGKSVEDAEGVIYVYHPFAEVVAVVAFLQQFLRLFLFLS